ncbi:hypothetical protein [Thermoflexus sp.]|uniref:hypothetical protein n=1 Tax=Thermoflexus sp. TaxID=1969742 RepID=UPI00175FBBEA|nr:hypothetical protein [Thermoflexus sp.]
MAPPPPPCSPSSYRYASAEEARRVANALAQGMQARFPGMKAHPEAGGWRLSVWDSEGGFLQVLLQARGEILSLLIVNGDSEARVRAIMDQAIQTLPTPPGR